MVDSLYAKVSHTPFRTHVLFTDVLISDCEDCVILLVNCRTVSIFFHHSRFFVLAAYFSSRVTDMVSPLTIGSIFDPDCFA